MLSSSYWPGPGGSAASSAAVWAVTGIIHPVFGSSVGSEAESVGVKVTGRDVGASASNCTGPRNFRNASRPAGVVVIMTSFSSVSGERLAVWTERCATRTVGTLLKNRSKKPMCSESSGTNEHDAQALGRGIQASCAKYVIASPNGGLFSAHQGEGEFVAALEGRHRQKLVDRVEVVRAGEIVRGVNTLVG